MSLEETTREHIFPLALGGADQFSAFVHKKENCRLNREIDAPLAASLFTAVARKRANARGHSGKDVRAPTVNAMLTGTGQTLQVFFRDDGCLGLLDPRLGSEVKPDRLLREGFRLEYSEHRLLRLRFTAKVALGAGPQIFGKRFHSSQLQADLRALANLSPQLVLAEGRGTKLKGWAWPAPPLASDEVANGVLGALAKHLQASFLAVITQFAEGHILFACGVLGELIGCLLAPMELLELVGSRPGDMGLVYELRHGRLKVQTFRAALEDLQASLAGT